MSAHNDPRKRTPDFQCWDDLPDEALTDGKTVEQLLGIGSTTRYRLEDAGRLKGIKLGRLRRYRVGDIRKMIRGGADSTPLA